MDIDLNTYRVNVPSVKAFCEDNKRLKFSTLINRLGMLTGCPLIVLCYYYGELYGFTPEVNELIDSLKKFYGYEKVE